MRLGKVQRGHRLLEKLKLAVVWLASGGRLTDIVRTVLYRPELFGKHAMPWVHAVMRGPSRWQVGERELFAAFVSRQNHCLF